ARTCESGAAHAGVRQAQRAGDTLLGQPGWDFRERDVRGDPRIPQLVEDVELAGRAFQSDHLCRKGDLVVVGWAGKPHGLFVEWGKADRIGAPITRQAKGIAVILESKLAPSP